MYASARVGGARVVDGRDPARLGRRQRARDREPRPRARQRRAAGRGAHADPRPLGRAGRRGDGLLRDDVPRRRRRSRPTPRPTLGRAVGFRRPRHARAHRGRDGRRGPPRRSRRAVVERRQLPRRAARARRHAHRARARAAARPPGHRADAPDARRPGRGRRAVAGGDPLRAGGRRHVDHDRAAGRVQPRDPGPARRRGAQRVADLRRHRPPRAARARRRRSAASRRTRSAPRSRASCPRTPGSRRLHETGDAIQVGGARLCEGGVLPDARRARPLRGRHARRATTCPKATSCCRPGAASSSTRWCGTTSTR